MFHFFTKKFSLYLEAFKTLKEQRKRDTRLSSPLPVLHLKVETYVEEELRVFQEAFHMTTPEVRVGMAQSLVSG